MLNKSTESLGRVVFKAVAFHQGFNNAMMNTSCKPKFYRTLMKLMIDGWRQDFGEQLPVAIIGLCAGGAAQPRLNFEQSGLFNWYK